MQPNFQKLGGDRLNLETESLVVKILAHVFSRKKMDSRSLASLQADLSHARESFLISGFYKAANLVQEIDNLLTTVHESVSLDSNDTYLTKLESQLLIEASSALLSHYYDSNADEETFSVPQSLIDGLRSSFAIRKHELDYLEDRCASYRADIPEAHVVNHAN